MIRLKIFQSIFILLLGLFIACNKNSNQSNDNDTQTIGNISTTISTDKSKLARVLNFNTYTPNQVKFKYIFIDNSGKGERFPAPGPSDSELEAVLYYDSLTFQKILDLYKDTLFISPNYSSLQFDFDWLDENISGELLKSSKDYRGHPDIFLGTGNSGQLWFLDKKILIYCPFD